MSQPWFPFYVGDYVRDTARLSTEGHGAYLLLMLDYWANGAPPDDDETLSSIARLQLDRWLQLRHKIAAFFQIYDGVWSHKRIEQERKLANEKHEKRVNSGKSGGMAKAAKQNSSNATPKLEHCYQHASSKNEALPYQSQSQPQPLKKTGSRSIEGDQPASAPNQIDLEELIADKAAPVAYRFDEFWRSFPRRDGPNPRKTAETRFNALVKSGIDPEMLIAEAKKLAIDEGKRGNIGTRFIPQVATWLNQQRWSDHAAVSALADLSGAEFPMETAVQMFAKIGYWSRHAGPSPGDPGCRASPELLAQYGLDPYGRKFPKPEFSTETA